MPGHNWAFSVAFPHLFANCSQSGYLESPTKFWQDCFDPTIPELYTFIDGFLEEMARAFPDAVVHIGGDEVGTTCWANSTRIQKWLAEHQPPPPPGSPRMNVSGLYAYFEEKATGIARKHGKTVMAWDDVYQKAPAAVQAGKDIVHAWRSPAIGAAALEDGQSVVTSHGYYLTAGDGVDANFDITWEAIFFRDPSDFSAPPLSLAEPRAKEAKERATTGRFLGAEACLWGEGLMPTSSGSAGGGGNLFSVAFPRAAVFAERLWLPDRFFGHQPAHNPSHPPLPLFKGALSSRYTARLIMWGCQMMRRGVVGTPVDDRDHFPRRSLWQQCEVDLPQPRR